MVRERRLSSDGLRLFNLALMHPPPKNKIRNLLSCLFSSKYDDQIEEMVKQSRIATQQLLSYTNHKDININKLINNSMFNLIHSTLMNENVLLNRFEVKRNIRYYFDVIEKCYQTNDHHSALVFFAALSHHSLGQLKIKKRKKDLELIKLFEEKYGTFRNCYKHHLKDAMSNRDYQNYLPCLLVLNMHINRHKAMSTIGNCNLTYEPSHIKSVISFHAINFPYTGNTLALFEEPQISSNTELILLAQGVKN